MSKDPLVNVAGQFVNMQLQARVTKDGLEKFVADMNQPTRKKLKDILDRAIKDHGRTVEVAGSRGVRRRE